MITNFEDFSGLFSVNIDGDTLYLRLKYDENKKPFKVEIWLQDNKYQDLSVNIPDSKYLGFKEFYLNPKVSPEIVDTLEKEGFIEKTGKSSVAGDKNTKSYVLLV